MNEHSISREFADFVRAAQESLADIRPARRERRCVRPPMGCGAPITPFHDSLSAREYKISGLCQACQDKVFTEE